MSVPLLAPLDPPARSTDLYDYQELALDMVRQEVLAGRRRIILQLPTGAGKTRCAAKIMEGVLVKGKRGMFTVPLLSLVQQTIDRFWDFNVRAVGVIQGYHPMTDSSQPVQVASLPTLRNRKIQPPHVIVVDEAHLLDRAFLKMLATPEYANTIVVGLSATPWARGMGRHYECLLIPITMAELIQRGGLVPYRIFAPSDPDLENVTVSKGDYDTGELSEVMSEAKLVADVVDTWLSNAERRPTLCFAVDRAHAKKLQLQFNDSGVRAEYIDAYTEAKDRDAIGGRLERGEIDVVCNVGVLTTGLDWPFVSCIILARPSRSEMLFVQIIGRGLRTCDGKVDCLVLDHSGTSEKLGYPADIHYEDLDDGRGRKARREERKESKPKKCPQCKFLRPPKVHVCPACGFAPERQSKIKVEDGTLIERGGIHRPVTESGSVEQVWYSGLLHIAAAKGYQPGWAAQKFKTKFGHWPDGHSKRKAPPTEEIRRWVKSEMIRFIMSRKSA